MPTNKPGTPGKKGGDQSNKLSNTAIREKLRMATPRAIEKLVELLDSRNPNVSVAAAKTILSKVVPDLKATELTTTDEEGKPIPLLGGYSGYLHEVQEHVRTITKRTTQEILEELKKEDPDKIKVYITELGRSLEEKGA